MKFAIQNGIVPFDVYSLDGGCFEKVVLNWSPFFTILFILSFAILVKNHTI